MLPEDKALLVNQGPTLSERERVVIASCAETPKSKRQLAEELGVGYYTVRDTVDTLVRLGFLRLQPFRQNRHQVYIAAFSDPQGSVIRYSYQNRAIGAERAWQFFAREPERNPLLFLSENIAGILAHLMRRSILLRQGVNIDQLPYPPPSVSRNALIALRRTLQDIITLVDQIIASPIWADKEVDKSLGYELLDSQVVEKFSDLWVARSPKPTVHSAQGEVEHE